MIYLSLFHGIGAVDVAWLPLGWKCAAYAEIEPFPIAVTKHHHPDAPNLGDVTKITDEQIAALGPIDLVVGGSPCQDLSVAGKRAGLAGERSGLFHEQLRVYHAARTLCGARWLLWENVPGAFSTHGGRDFGVVVSSMAGSDFAVPRGGWGTCGAAIGPNGLVEWRVLDAQYVRVQSHPAAVPQRRRRVFALLDSGNWRDRPPVLLEPEGLRGDPPPRREAGQGIAGSITRRIDRGGVNSEGNDGHLVAHCLKAEGFDAGEDGTGRGTPLVPAVAGTMKACRDSGGWSNSADHAAASYMIPAVCGTLSDGAHFGGGSTARTPTRAGLSPLPPIAWALQERDAKGADSSTKPGHLIPVGGVFDAPIPFDTTQVTSAANRSTPRAGDPSHPLAAHAHAHAPAIAMAVRTANTSANGHGVAEEVAHTLDQAQGQAIAFSCKDHGADAGEVSPTLRSMEFDATHANGGGQVAVAFPINADALRGEGTAKTPGPDAEGRVRLRDPWLGVGSEGDPAGTVSAAGPGAVAVAFKASHYTRGKDGAPDEVTPPLSADADKGDQDTIVASAVGFDEVADPVAANQARTYTREGTNNFRVSNVAIAAMQVRRLTPRECERLQGFPDDYTAITVRGKPAADGPRYRALGNSMAVNVMRWIGDRISAVEQAKREELAA